MQVFVDYLRSEKYNKLLEQFCLNEDLKELLECAALDKQRAKEREYLISGGKYPDDRDGLNKLIYDLYATKEVMIKNKLGGKNEEIDS